MRLRLHQGHLGVEVHAPCCMCASSPVGAWLPWPYPAPDDACCTCALTHSPLVTRSRPRPPYLAEPCVPAPLHPCTPAHYCPLPTSQPSRLTDPTPPTHHPQLRPLTFPPLLSAVCGIDVRAGALCSATASPCFHLGFTSALNRCLCYLTVKKH